MKKTAEDFKKIAKEKNISRWNIHDCSMCSYPCGFIIMGDDVSYDSGCSCARGELRPSSWQEIAESYNCNAGSDDAEERYKKNPRFGEVIREYNDFWGFENPSFLK